MKKLDKTFEIQRHDFSKDRSLRPHSAADEYLLSNINALQNKPKQITIYNDRFGYLSCHLNQYNPNVIITNKSQQKAIELNFIANNLKLPKFVYPLSGYDKAIDLAIVKVPKSLALFELFLQDITQNSTKELTVVIAFMTRHFSPKLIEIAEEYFELVTQSKAVKKSRIAQLSSKKEVRKKDLIDVLQFRNQDYKQYWGVFSAKHIDYATQYFLEHLELKATDETVLDLASGNGVIAKSILTKSPNTEIHLIDDSYLAVESGKMNLSGKNIYHHFNNDLSDFQDQKFDLIATNPPFHFEYEVNINITLRLFKECYRCLKDNGNLQVVASRHLNYLTHLKPLFSTVEVLAKNDKFIIYKCVK